MSRYPHLAKLLPLAASICLLAPLPARAAQQPDDRPQSASGADAQAAQPPAAGLSGKLTVTVGKSLTIDSPLKIKRLSTANGNLVEAVAIGPKEVLINGKAPGETSLIIWQENDTRLMYDLTVRISPIRLNAVREQIARDFPDADISVTFDNDTPFVRGTVKDVTSADRVMAIVATLGKGVNLLRVDVPPVEPQILLKVRFANVSRTATLDLGFNLATGAFNQSTAVGTGAPLSSDGARSFSLGSAVNIFMFRKDLNLVAALQALEGKHLLETLAEPNLLVINGTPAHFLAGGEFPYPMVQPSATGTSVTVAFREYGIRLNFLPVITPRGTIRMQVAPEVSSLDYSNSVTLQGFVIPGISERRVQTEVELESGQSFVIAGLLDNATQDNLSRIPGIGSIPLLGKLFQTKNVSRTNSELLIVITPEIVRPIPAQQPVPELKYTVPFMKSNSNIPMQQPGMDKTGPVAVHPPADSIPIEQLIQQQQKGQAAPAPSMPQYQLVPVPAAPPSLNPGLTPTPAGSGAAGAATVK
ncbi:MAG: pilus assembly protein N-terminal domain-containing protein [Acidobacteriia bacterium]|nr:pilus assembly protein N-terminal domain-containing protein [Terriglobia bacterium]